MILKLFSICVVVQLVVAQDFPITFKDGKIGVNFGGYSAEAGLGGLLTGNAAHGGLQASAKTPYGQAATAGLGGSTGPNNLGGLFAGATAGNGVNAEASLAGDLNQGFGVGSASAAAGGAQSGVIKTVSSAPYPPASTQYLPTQQTAGSSSSSSSVLIPSESIDEDDNDLTDNKVPQNVPQTVPQQTITQVISPPATINVQKIKVKTRPQPLVQVAQRVEEVQTTTGPTTTTTPTTPRPPYVYTYDKQKVINEIFSIPFQVLRSVNEIINQKLAGGYTVQKTITY